MTQRRTNRSSEEQIVSGDAVKECVRYIICREGSKVAIKRTEISKHLNTTCQTATNQVNAIIVAADRILKQTYGYKLIQVEAKSGIQYIVALTEDCESLPSTSADPEHRRLLVAALMHIYMSGGPVKEEDMFKFLTEAGLIEENDQVTKKILTSTFTRQMYLQYSKVGEGDFARFVFDWGQRAKEEVPKKFLLKKMAKAFEKEPDYWSEQYKEAVEGQRSNTPAAT